MLRQLLGLAPKPDPRQAPAVVAGVARSPKWAAFEREFLKGKTCLGCGRADLLSAHHILPFHVDQVRELDPTNLAPLCHGPTFCHFVLGPCNQAWTAWHPDPAAAAKVYAELLARLKKSAVSKPR